MNWLNSTVGNELLMVGAMGITLAAVTIRSHARSLSQMQYLGFVLIVAGEFISFWGSASWWWRIGVCVQSVGLYLVLFPPPDDPWKRRLRSLQTRLKTFRPLAYGVPARRPT